MSDDLRPLDMPTMPGDELVVRIRILPGSVRVTTGLTLAGVEHPTLRDHTTYRGQVLAGVVRRDMLRELHMACQLAVKYAPRPLW